MGPGYVSGLALSVQLKRYVTDNYPNSIEKATAAEEG